MKPGIVLIFVFAILVIIALVIVIVSKSKIKKKSLSDKGDLIESLDIKENSLTNIEEYEMAFKFEDLPTLTEDEDNRLAEVSDEKLLGKIDNLIPGAMQVIKDVSQEKKGSNLYQVIIPKGAKLDQSKQIKGAVRATYRTSGKIQGQGNMVEVGTKASNVANIASAAMGVASMVVGQYYMDQINGQLEDICDSIEKVADFQQNEFKSKIYSLVAETQKISTFQFEILESDQLRNRELQHLKSLEHECSELLGQTNLSLQDISQNRDIEYDKYENLIKEANLWYEYQKILLDVMFKIADLTYALNMGVLSRENSYALYLPYAKQAENSLLKLANWHKEIADKLEVSLEDGRRKMQGLGGFLIKYTVGQINDDFNYKTISEETTMLIERQSEESQIALPKKDDLYQEDVRLIAKEGKLFYLPK